ncbi:androgen-induced gene 1 protein isoform X3 [Brachyhypopomus gauderio]|uniref:androgen-induced gene 1 protein isoform X3 n=1 Tax=Brachyhypopomus gauderio TaxID=698409 RepID=UPI00404295DE
MALIPSQILRVAILLSYFSIICNYKAIDMPAHQTYGGSWKFLTFINLHLDQRCCQQGTGKAVTEADWPA